MTWWLIPGQGTVWIDESEGAHDPTEGTRLPVYWNTYQYSPAEGSTVGGPHFQWSIDVPGAGNAPSGYNIAPGYLGMLLDMAARSEMGQLSEGDRWQWEDMRTQAQAIPMRDVNKLYVGWTGSNEDQAGQWLLSPNSPDVGAVMLNIRDKIMKGTASGHEQALYQQMEAMGRDWNWRASVPQPSDVGFGLGDNLFGALTMLGIGAGMGGIGAGLATLPGIASAAGTAGSVAGMMGQALDEKWLKLAGMGLGMAGGAASLGNLASQGVNSVGDALKLAQKVYSLGNKAYGMAQLAGQEDPAQAGLRDVNERLYSMDPSYAGRQIGSRSQVLTSGRSSGSGGGGGGGMEVNELGALLSAIVGGVGTTLSLVDAARYMGQLKDQYGDQQGIKDMIDSAYQLATSRYQQYYASTLQQQAQQQESYQDAWEKYQKHYQDTQLEQAQRQEAYGEQRGQIAEDRQRSIANWEKGIQKYDDNFAELERMAREDRDRRINVFGEDRQLALASYNRRVAEAAQDRDFKKAIFNQDYARYQTNFDERRAQAAAEHAMDLSGYQARHQIGAGLRDPAQIVAGAKGIYNPLSDLAREMTSRDVQAEMAMRGVSGQGQYANIMSARAYAPLEQRMWETALQGWLNSQQTAVGAYGNMDLAQSPEYQFARVPDFGTSPEYQYTQVPNMGFVPRYEIQNTPAFARQSGANVPGAVDLPGAPRVPTAVPPGDAPGISRYTATPYAPFGSSPATGSTALKGVGDYISNLTKMVSEGGPLAGLAKKFLSMLGLGGGDYLQSAAYKAFTGWGDPYGPGSSGDPTFAYEDSMDYSDYGPYIDAYQYSDYSQYGPYLPEYQFENIVPELDLSY